MPTSIRFEGTSNYVATLRRPLLVKGGPDCLSRTAIRDHGNMAPWRIPT